MNRSFFESASAFARGEREEKLEVFSTLLDNEGREVFELEQRALRLSLQHASQKRTE